MGLIMSVMLTMATEIELMRRQSAADSPAQGVRASVVAGTIFELSPASPALNRSPGRYELSRCRPLGLTYDSLVLAFRLR
jgi:hypothetical protein